VAVVQLWLTIEPRQCTGLHTRSQCFSLESDAAVLLVQYEGVWGRSLPGKVILVDNREARGSIREAVLLHNHFQ